MHFCSREYLFFLSAVFVIYWLLRWHTARVWLLLAASFFFYARWNSWLAVLIGVSSSLDYVIGRGLEACADGRRRKWLLALSLVGNLGLLGYFKYANFFLRSLEESLHAAGLSASLP